MNCAIIFARSWAWTPPKHGPQTTPDGKFTVEFVECLASCGTAPVVMVNEDFYEGVTAGKADQLLAQCQ